MPNLNRRYETVWDPALRRRGSTDDAAHLYSLPRAYTLAT